jgi:hypothetical protein
MIMPNTESSITVNFPDNNYFRFQDCSGYTKYSGNQFKEMDWGWFDTTNAELYLIELKDFTNASVIRTTPDANSRVNDLVKKAADSTAMLVSILLKTAPSIDITACLPQNYTNRIPLNIINIIHCKPTQQADIQYLHQQFRLRFKPYADFFGVKQYAVMSHNQATKRFDWIL